MLTPAETNTEISLCLVTKSISIGEVLLFGKCKKTIVRLLYIQTIKTSVSYNINSPRSSFLSSLTVIIPNIPRLPTRLPLHSVSHCFSHLCFHVVLTGHLHHALLYLESEVPPTGPFLVSLRLSSGKDVRVLVLPWHSLFLFLHAP